MLACGELHKVRIWDDKWLCNGAPINFRQDVVEELGLKMVVDLLLPSGAWNMPLIEWTFCPAIVKRILVTPLALTPMEDSLFWMGTNDGVYSAKTGYVFLQQFDDQGVASHLRLILWMREGGKNYGLLHLFHDARSYRGGSFMVWYLCGRSFASAR